MYSKEICHNQTFEWNREKCPVFPEERSCIIFCKVVSTFLNDGFERKISHRRVKGIGSES